MCGDSRSFRLFKNNSMVAKVIIGLKRIELDKREKSLVSRNYSEVPRNEEERKRRIGNICFVFDFVIAFSLPRY